MRHLFMSLKSNQNASVFQEVICCICSLNKTDSFLLRSTNPVDPTVGLIDLGNCCCCFFAFYAIESHNSNKFVFDQYYITLK